MHYTFCSSLNEMPSGNAKVAGMSTDLNLTGLKYNIAAAVFFVRRGTHSFHEITDSIPLQITFCLAEVPSYV
jgi:hypothetical protein